ncbi:hypothetical protein [Pseudodesulfovibrio sp.]|uniref:hypothetical protein n=1 Tax=unclassified Pseudodesulfovibrio TaxID=2661612 RepID=UPI003B0066E1
MNSPESNSDKAHERMLNFGRATLALSAVLNGGAATAIVTALTSGGRPSELASLAPAIKTFGRGASVSIYGLILFFLLSYLDYIRINFIKHGQLDFFVELFRLLSVLMTVLSAGFFMFGVKTAAKALFL